MLLSHILPMTYEAQQRKSRAKDQMAFQERMSGSAYQRAMDDMRLAGLNPILAGKLGGASTPAGAMASTPNFGQTMSNAVSQATQMKLASAQAETQSQTAKKLSIENELLKDDLKMLRKLGLSQISAKHTPSNIGGSMILQKILDAFSGNKSSLLTDDTTSSVKGHINNMNNIKRDREFYNKQRNRIKSLESLGYYTHASKNREFYWMVHPKNHNIRYKMYYEKD